MQQYLACPPDDLAVRRADGLAIVYHRASGQTHVMAPPMLALIEALADGPADAPTLLDRLRRTHALETEDGEDAAEIIAARLAELHARGLVERSPGERRPR